MLHPTQPHVYCHILEAGLSGLSAVQPLQLLLSEVLNKVTARATTHDITAVVNIPVAAHAGHVTGSALLWHMPALVSYCSAATSLTSSPHTKQRPVQAG